MRVLIFHGYLLRGTGSNVYNASLAPALARLGHDVELFCQDWEADELDWVDRFIGSRGGERKLAGPDSVDGTPDRGTVTVHVPDIGRVLPVYVADTYEGFDARVFPELSDTEIERYIAANVAAVREWADEVGGFDAALANHLVMGPVILARAGLSFATKIHGSALSYTVKPHRERFRPFAREGMVASSGVLVGSRHIAESLWETVEDPELPAKTRLGPPGVDRELFAPIERAEAPARLRELAEEIREVGEAGLGRDGAASAEAVEHFAAAGGARVVFVGKLIVSKGVDLLLAAWPLVHRENPGARLMLVGFGEYREATERLLRALEAGDIAEARAIAAAGRALEGGPAQPLRMLEAFLESAPEGYADAARAAAGSVALGGRLEHAEVGRLVPAADAMVVPSTFPESFGMVAAEAAAAGVLPVCADHSGLHEVAAALAEAVSPEVGRLLSFPLGEHAVTAIAERVNAWLALGPDERREAEAALSARSTELWSWEGVARGVLAASAGDLGGLTPVPED
jgi:glycosyltransferase involved in cell wall biosynthesis